MDFSALMPDGDYCTHIGNDVWLMDDHRWAFYAWAACAQTHADWRKAALVHLDHHWDDINDFHDRPDDRQRLRNASLKQIFELVKAGQQIRYDSFIAPAVITGIFKSIHFYCVRHEDDDPGIDPPTLQEAQAVQFFYEQYGILAAQRLQIPFVMDLCLDLFNKNDEQCYEGDLWAESDIREFVNAFRDKWRDAALVTISLSFGCSGTEQDTRWLASLVVPRIQEIRNGS